VNGQLELRWAKWLDGMAIVYAAQDETVLNGPAAD
jgi:hypothetical protein